MSDQEIKNLNHLHKITLTERFTLSFSADKLEQKRTAYDVVYLYLTGKYNLSIPQSELDRVWKEVSETITFNPCLMWIDGPLHVIPARWKAFQHELLKLAKLKCREGKGRGKITWLF